VLGTQEVEDGYDVIEVVAKGPWCTGNVGMAGNSHLAQRQWFIATERPPSLRAIAPWEATQTCIARRLSALVFTAVNRFDELISKYVIHGREIEDTRAMFDKYPLANGDWKDKQTQRVHLMSIFQPIYSVRPPHCRAAWSMLYPKDSSG
jgi:putative CocE/NonD family hydrolase